jgi:bifunctional non-homologous end joining protein LigD
MAGDDPLSTYKAKRHFATTPEPPGEVASTEGSSFVVQKHRARRLHYDFRLEVEGVMPSWAVPKGPSYDPTVKRLAVHVEDHPLDYRTFEGNIPGGEYGAGSVIVWDQGTYRNITEHDGKPMGMRAAIEKGHVSVWLDGAKLHGGWSLTRTRGDDWIMVKRRDEWADASVDVEEAAPQSAVSGRTIEEVAQDKGASTWTRGVATWSPPMLATLVDADQWLAQRHDGWAFQRKLDGLRCVAVRNGDHVELWSRNHNSFNVRFPKVVADLRSQPVDNFTLDGELVAHNGKDFVGFGQLQQHGSTLEVIYCVFDVLHLVGNDTKDLPLDDRARLLREAITPAAHLQLVEDIAKPSLPTACRKGWEGLIAKRRAAVYRAERSSEWVKLKCSASQELVIGGWTEPQGSRHGFGALLVGYYDGDALRYAGKVGTGYTEKTLASLSAELHKLERPTSPFDGAIREKGTHWAEPELVAEIAFTEWTRDGRLRHPRFEGLRPDKRATAVVRERKA